MSESPPASPVSGASTAGASSASSSLPYRDTKPQGAADFYFAINATFRFFLSHLGYAAWVAYLQDMARRYFEPVNQRWRAGGLAEVAAYWRAFFAAEPGADVAVVERKDAVELRVRTCPAIAHLRKQGREIVREYCQHCYHLGEARAQAAGMAMRLEGGDGSCVHTYYAAPGPEVPVQDLRAIREAR